MGRGSGNVLGGSDDMERTDEGVAYEKRGVTRPRTDEKRMPSARVLIDLKPNRTPKVNLLVSIRSAHYRKIKINQYI
jgi:hypothetical protein